VTAVAITGWSALTSAGIGPEAVAAALAQTNGGLHPGHEVAHLYEHRLPAQTGHALVDFDVRDHLDRKGTSFLDRCTSLVLVTCGHALTDSALEVDDETRDRIGVMLGTTSGSLRSMSDYTRETLIEERPYLVNPALFPNTVINCAAGQTAIRYGLRGVNSTLAAGQIAFPAVLRYAARTLRRRGADALVAGAVEEFTPHRAWVTHLTQAQDAGLPVGEGSAVFVVERAEEARRAGRHVDAEVLAAVTAFCPTNGQRDGLAKGFAACVRRALDQAGVEPGEVALVAAGAAGGVEEAVLAEALGRDVETIRVKSVFGECDAASGALQAASVLALHRDDPARDGQVSLLTAWTREGGVGAVVLRGWSRGGRGRG
jgi:3-oxoacyl-[acyl-carrier-protein] synthase II